MFAIFARLSEADVELAQGAADVRIRAVPNDLARFVLVKIQQDVILRKPDRLGDAVSDHKICLSRDWIGGSSIVHGGASEKRHDVADSSHADSENQRIVRGVNEFIEQVGPEAGLQTKWAASGVPGNAFCGNPQRPSRCLGLS